MHSAATPRSTTPPTSNALPPGARPDLRFLFARPAHFIALGFGSGLARKGPGTWGTVFAWASFLLLDPWLSDAAWGAAIGAGLAVGAWAAQRTGTALGQADSGHIVIDEIVAFWLVLLLLPDAGDGAWSAWLWQAGAFVLFRALDIGKPPPIRWFDARYKNGVGVMLDDLVAAFLTLLAFAVAIRVS
jgi:phosphatidylglycerophosphatase A